VKLNVDAECEDEAKLKKAKEQKPCVDEVLRDKENELLHSIERRKLEWKVLGS
jgi:hypothetical protein